MRQLHQQRRICFNLKQSRSNHQEAKETIKRVRAAGVEVIAVDYSEYNRMAGGMDCATMQILRDPGPRKFS